MGYHVGGKADVTPHGELELRELPLDLETETARTLERRPDLKLARLLVRNAANEQRIMEAAYYPKVDGVISGTYIPISEIRQGSEGSPRRVDDIISSEVRGGGVFTWRIMDSGRTGGAVLRLRAAREVNQLLLQKLEANVPRELARIRNNLRSIEGRRKSLAAAIELAEQNITAIEQSLMEGFSSQLEFRTAESSFLETKGGLVSIAYQHNVARAEWDRATGGYFQFSDDTAENLH
jgi:outer membrane protein TolC